MEPRQAAQARHYSYTLLSQLYLNGLEPDLRDYLPAIPELAAYMPEPFDADEAAAAHFALFGMNLFPFESLFLDASGLLGGETSEQVGRVFRAIGFDAGPTAVAPDHIGHELAALAFLSHSEAQALDYVPNLVASLRTQQRTLLEEHLLRWLPALVVTVRREANPFYTAVADLTLALVADHYAALLDGTPPRAIGFALPTQPDVLAGDGSGLKEIAAVLVAPPLSGVFLGRDQISRVARALALPRGFGDRVQLLTNLLRTAVQYDLFAAVVQALFETVGAWQQAYRAIGAAHPALVPFLAPWIAQTQHSLNVLAEMHAASNRP